MPKGPQGQKPPADVIGAAGSWYIYRVVKGWLRLSEGSAVAQRVSQNITPSPAPV